MPYDNLPESKWPKMERCVSSVMEQGRTKEAAIAICYESVKADKTMPGLAALKLDLSMFDDPKPRQAIKAAGDFALDVLGIPFGGPSSGKDLHGQYFSPRTKTYLDGGKEYPVFYYHGLGDDGKPSGNPELIGSAKYSKTDTDGHWFKVTLDATKNLARKVWEAAKAGAARASSGAVSHLVRLAKDGEILNWVMGELSVFDTENGKRPANNYAVALPAMKSNYELAGLELPTLPDDESDESAGSAGENQPAIKTNVKDLEELTMEEKTVDIQALVAEEMKKAFAAKAAEEKAQADQAAAIKAAVDAEREKWEKEDAVDRRLPMKGAPAVKQFADTDKYDNLDAAELGLMIDVQKGFAAKGMIEPPSLGAKKALMLKVARLGKENGISGETAAYATQGLKAAIGHDLSDEAIKAATDPMYTTTGIGTEWIGTAYANQLWESIRAMASVVAKIPSVTIPDGYNNQYFPLEYTDPTWYKVAEVTANDSTMKTPVATVTTSQMGTAQKQITVAKMGARVQYSQEVSEDSLINFVGQLRRQIEISGAEQLEHVVIDGDTSTSSNINDIGGTTYSGASTTLFLLFDGLRHLGLITNTANSRSAAGALSEDDYLNTVKMLGTAGLGGADKAKCAFIVDPNTYWASLKLATLKTKDVWTNATLENGELTRLWGYPVNVSWFMHKFSTDRLANSAGKVDNDTTTNNLYGAILAVRWDQWKFAYRRRMTMETVRRAESDSWDIIALSRVGLGYRDTEAAAISYYVGV